MVVILDKKLRKEIDEVLKERERCINIVVRKTESVIKQRDRDIKNVSRRLTSVFRQLEEDIVFLIDHPDYVRKTKNKDSG